MYGVRSCSTRISLNAPAFIVFRGVAVVLVQMDIHMKSIFAPENIFHDSSFPTMH